MAEPRAVILDFYDTLAWLDPEAVAGTRAAVARILDVTPEALRTAYRDSFAGRVLGGYGDGRQEMAHIATECGLAVGGEVVERALEAELEGWLGAAHLYPDVATELGRMRESGLRLAS